MNLAAYLQMEVKPLAAYVPECEKRQKEQEQLKSAERRMGPNHGCENANRAKHEQAVERYTKAMRGTWARTVEIENRLGLCRAGCMPNLLKWEKMGIVERRKAGPSGNWNRRIGYEWRMVSPASEKG